MTAIRSPLVQRGFTLTELTIVLVIVALLIGGMLLPLSAQRDIRSTDETLKRLAEAKEALLGFAVINRRLPCPADPKIPSGSAGAGIEYPPSSEGCTTSIEGSLPWATLGLAETDAWGRRLSYRVTAGFAKTVPATQNASFILSPSGDGTSPAGNIDILATSSGATLASKIPAVIISHGKNGLGAFLPTGAQMDASTDGDEQENYDSDADFVSKAATPSFDDLVGFTSPAILLNRMISGGRLP